MSPTTRTLSALALPSSPTAYREVRLTVSPTPTFNCFAMSSGSATSLESFGWSPSVIFTGSMFFCAAVEMISPLTVLSPLETLTPVSTEARTPPTPSMPAIWSR